MKEKLKWPKREKVNKNKKKKKNGSTGTYWALFSTHLVLLERYQRNNSIHTLKNHQTAGFSKHINTVETVNLNFFKSLKDLIR